MGKYRKWKPKIILDHYDCDPKGIMHKSHSCSYLIYHFSFIPKYRGRVFTNSDLIAKISKYVKEVCYDRYWFIHKLSFGVDHVHLELQLPPTISPTKAMNIIKGYTSRFVRIDYPKFKWAIGYWAGTVGKANKEIIDSYIGGQRVCVV